MQAARLHEYGKPLSIDEVARPTPGAGQVVIRVEGAGFCHSDLHIISGDIQILPRMPLTLGHENAGTVSAIGDGVDAVKEGDHLAVYAGATDSAITAPLARRTSAQRCSGSDCRSTRAATPSTCSWPQRYPVKLNTFEPKAAAPLTDAALTPYRAITRALPHVTRPTWRSTQTPN